MVDEQLTRPDARMSTRFHLARKLINVRREQQLRWLWSHFIPVRHRSGADNIYHCCVWKTASQWIRNVLSSTTIYQYSGLLAYAYEQHEGRDDRALQVRTFDKPFPLRKIISPLYITRESFDQLPKPRNFRAFFVVRDPRDLVVSHYFSSRYSHLDTPSVLAERAKLIDVPERDGMIVHMQTMRDLGVFEALRSCAEQSDADDRVKVFRFEDLVGDRQAFWITQLLDHCDIRVPRAKLDAILKRLSFERLSGGRHRGEENTHHKYRSGKHGDWTKYFDERCTECFARFADGLPEVFGYD
jgi:Sulfotransferase domain